MPGKNPQRKITSIKVPIPPLAKQLTILQVAALHRKEMALHRELQALRDNQIQNLLRHSIR